MALAEMRDAQPYDMSTSNFDYGHGARSQRLSYPEFNDSQNNFLPNHFEARTNEDLNDTPAGGQQMKTFLNVVQPPSTPVKQDNMEIMITEQELNSFYDPLDALNKKYPE